MPRKNKQMPERIISCINEHIRTKGYPPSVREICTAVGLKSPSSVHAYLERLKDSGALLKDATKPRALKVAGNVPSEAELGEFIEVPVIGTVAAGQPITAYENITAVFPLPGYFARNMDLFMLKVRGDSMINAGILEGDLVIVQKQETAQNGDIIVALLEDEATVKRFFKENGSFRLQPENDFMEPIIVDSLSVIGKVVGVFRSMI